MSWAPWPAAAAQQPPVVAPATPLLNPAPAVMPPGLPYSTDQWTQMQQQNWQQWAQWQQQYQQWHQQYGAEYQKSMNALAAQQTAPPNLGVPPPLPVETQPPLPQEDVPKPAPPLPGVLGQPQQPPLQYSTQPPPNNNFSAPPPNYSSKPPQPEWRSETATLEPKRPLADADDSPAKRQMANRPAWRNQPNTAQPPAQTWPGQNATSTEELSEAEKKFDKQFAEWEAQFNKWKDQNSGHPDKQQYKEYEKKWEQWRQQLLERREAMRKKRLSLTGPAKTAPNQMFNVPPPAQGAMTSQPPPIQSIPVGPPPVPKQPTGPNTIMPGLPKEGLLPTPSLFHKPPPDMNDEPLQFKKTEEELEPPEGAIGFLSTSKSEGIPGLDLVKEGDPEPIDEEEELPPPNKGPDLDAISKGISNILGDQKLMSMLSMVQNQSSNIAPKMNEVFPQDHSNLSADDSRNEPFAQAEGVQNFDDQTRSSFTMQPNDSELFKGAPPVNQFIRGFQPNFNTEPPFNRGQPPPVTDRFDSKPFGGPNDDFRRPPPNRFGPSDDVDQNRGPLLNRPGNFDKAPPGNMARDNVANRGPGGPLGPGSRDSLGLGLANSGRDMSKPPPEPHLGYMNRDQFGPGMNREDLTSPGQRSKFGPGMNRDDFAGPNALSRDKFGLPPHGPGILSKDNYGGQPGPGNRENFGGPREGNLSKDNFGGPPGRGNLKRDNFGGPPGQGNLNRDNFGGPLGPRNLDRDNFGGLPGQGNLSKDNLGGPLGQRNLDRDNFGVPSPGNRNRDNFGGPQGPGNMSRDKFGGPGNQNRDHFGGLYGASSRDTFGGPGNQSRESFGAPPSPGRFGGPGNLNRDNFGGPSGPGGVNRDKIGPAGRDRGNFESDNFNRGSNQFGRGNSGPDRFGNRSFDDNSGPYGGGRDSREEDYDYEDNEEFEDLPPEDSDFGEGHQNFGKGPTNQGMRDDFNKPPPNFNQRPPNEGTGLRNEIIPPGRGNFANRDDFGDRFDTKKIPPLFSKGPMGQEPHRFDNRPNLQHRLEDKFAPRSNDPPNFRDNYRQGNYRDEEEDYAPPPPLFGPTGQRDMGPRGRSFGNSPLDAPEPPQLQRDHFDDRFEDDRFDDDRFEQNSSRNEFESEEIVAEADIEPIWKPTSVVDYEHKSLKPPEPDVLLEPFRMFDYRHKPLRRIPFPERPNWLSDSVRMIPEFDPPIIRPPPVEHRMYDGRFEPPPSRRDDNDLYENPRGGDRYDRRGYEMAYSPPPPKIDMRSRRYEEDSWSSRRDRNESPPRFERRGADRERTERGSNRSRERIERGRSRDWEERDVDDWEGENGDRRGGGDCDIRVVSKEWSGKDDWKERDRDRRGGQNNKEDRWKNKDKEWEERGRQWEEDDMDMSDRERSRERDLRFRNDRNKERDLERDNFSRKPGGELFPARKSTEEKKISNITLIEELLYPPGRLNRAPRIVIILRGPPGSGKTFLAKLIKDKEVENGGSAPRILSLDDYFMVEQEKEVVEDGKRIKMKDMVYEFEAEMEESYRMSLMKSFKKTITDGYFPFIIVDNVNDKVKYFGEMWSFAKQNGFQVYICQLDLDVQNCSKRNIHNRTEEEIRKCVQGWENTPSHHPVLDVTSVLQDDPIPEVEMEEVNSAGSCADDNDDGLEERLDRSRWDNFDCSINNLARLDGVNKPLRPSRTMEEYLQLDDDWQPTKPTKPGQKRVRWADLEERKQQEKMRAIGFVVGQTDWERMMDPTMGESALTQTKYIEKAQRRRF